MNAEAVEALIEKLKTLTPEQRATWLDRAPARGVRAVSSGTVGLVLN